MLTEAKLLELISQARKQQEARTPKIALSHPGIDVVAEGQEQQNIGLIRRGISEPLLYGIRPLHTTLPGSDS